MSSGVVAVSELTAGLARLLATFFYDSLDVSGL